MQSRLHSVHPLAPILGLALFIDLLVRLLHHPQPLHPQNISLQECLFGLQPSLQVGNLLGVASRGNLFPQLINPVDALARRIVDLFTKAHLSGIPILDPGQFLRIEIIGVGAVGRVTLQKP